jgi:hypothetical protein
MGGEDGPSCYVRLEGRAAGGGTFKRWADKASLLRPLAAITYGAISGHAVALLTSPRRDKPQSYSGPHGE